MSDDRIDELDALIEGAEDLLIRLAGVHDPRIQQLRDRVDHAIGDARRALARPLDGTSVQIKDIVRTIDDYVRDYPWLAVTTGILAAGAVGFILGGARNVVRSAP